MAFQRPARQLLTCGLVLCWLCLPVEGIGYDDFPESLQRILDERIDELNSQDGVCLAGRVTLSDGVPIRSGQDVQVNADVHGDVPIWVYEDGWFIMEHRPGIPGPDKPVHVRAFGYDPIDTPVDVLKNAITYREFELVKTPPERLATVVGIVRDEDDQPFNGAWVLLTFPFSSHGYTAEMGYSYAFMSQQTGPDGRFSFYGLSSTEHVITAGASEYAYHTGTFMPLAGGQTTQDRKLYPNRRIVIDYVYQPDGSRSFDNNQAIARTINWLNGSGHIDFSLGQLIRSYYDLGMRQTQDVLIFRCAYVNAQTGFYDAGAVAFDSVTEAAEDGYSTTDKPCLVGHVYVVRTWEEGHYVKFIVQSDECSFRTVVPGDSRPIHFAGYGLTIDLHDCDDYAKVYVRKDSGMPPGLETPALPYYQEITGMDERVFSADILFAYDPNDVANAGLSERSLAIYRSRDDGATWQRLDTEMGPTNRTLRAKGLDAFGLFAIGGQYQSLFTADLDGSAIVDFNDFALFGTQWRSTEDQSPLEADLDDSGIVDCGDLTTFAAQWLKTEE